MEFSELHNFTLTLPHIMVASNLGYSKVFFIQIIRLFRSGTFLFIALLLAYLPLSAQDMSKVQAQIQGITSPELQQKKCYEQAVFLRQSNPQLAMLFAQKAIELALFNKNKAQEAQACWIGGELAEQLSKQPEAIRLFTQSREAANLSNLPDIQLKAVTKLETITLGQDNYKAAYEWGLEKNMLLRNRDNAIAQAKDMETATEKKALLEKIHQHDQYLWIALAAFGLFGLLFYQSRQRSNKRIRGEMAEKNALIEEKRRRSEHLLLNILPRAVAAELSVRNKVAARRYEKATVMFIDFVSFTQIAEQMSPEDLVATLDICFSSFDDIIGRNKIEKIKTVGDAYICASGLSDRNEHPADMIKAALQIQVFLGKLREKHRAEGKPSFEARIGIHFGAVVAGVVGTKKFAYDIWGDTVNLAARLEQSCEPGHVNVSGMARSLVIDEFDWTFRGKVAAKNKGELDMFYVHLK
jgi:class 3 adenylate cyclase